MSASMQLPTGLISDVSFPLLAKDIEFSSGIALDIGSTVGKIVYRSNKEYKDGRPLQLQDESSKGTLHYAMFPRKDVTGMNNYVKDNADLANERSKGTLHYDMFPRKDVTGTNNYVKDNADLTEERSKGTLHYAMFPRNDVTSLINYVKENADLTRNEEGVLVVNASGVGGAAFKQEIEEGLNCKLDILNEFDCFCQAFINMKRSFTDDELCDPEPPAEKAINEESKIKFKQMTAKYCESSQLKFDLEDDSIKDEDRPELLVMGGSGTCLMKINKDETYTLKDVMFTAGRFLYGLAAGLTGENDFNKIVELAKRGDGRTSDSWTSELLGTGDNHGDNPYDAAFAENDLNMFPLGKCISTKLENMRKEDLAYSSFNVSALIHCQLVYSCAKVCKAKHIYFSGNVFNTEFMRSLMREKVHRVTMFNPSDINYEFHFLKNGGMFGALGAFISKKKAE